MTCFQKALSTSLILFAGAVMAGEAVAEEVRCGARSAVISALVERFGESRRAIGLDTRGIVEVFASAETGSWTVTITLPDGRTCLLAAGQHFQADPGAPVSGPAA